MSNLTIYNRNSEDIIKKIPISKVPIVSGKDHNSIENDYS